MMMLREHEIGDRRLSEPSYSVAPISLMDPTVCITMCCSLLYHVMVCVHLIICMLYYCTTTGLASTSVFGCLWLSVVLVILVRDSWVNRWSTFSGRIVVVLKKQLDIGLSTVAFVCLFASILGVANIH
ncbi:hypothetical protein Naga_101002g2 [Nannochloropsis gaditana]|uniref:Transmembrane protein n=1 Tax=Nannochloropsis gaditana TaxID=72520 RepID=W7TGX5_9STRA|nr:hypothetical protein Naga_101002g2 [Nannochloropsis gaditana]